MIGVDTNVLVRYLAQDDPDQAALATQVFEGQQADRVLLVPLVLAETWWVLARSYRMAPAAIADVVAGLLTAEEVVVADEPLVRAALEQARHGDDFADALIDATCRAGGAERTLTFDRKAARLPGMRLLS